MEQTLHTQITILHCVQHHALNRRGNKSPYQQYPEILDACYENIPPSTHARTHTRTKAQTHTNTHIAHITVIMTLVDSRSGFSDLEKEVGDKYCLHYLHKRERGVG